jgi:uncharacterized protein YqeY
MVGYQPLQARFVFVLWDTRFDLVPMLGYNQYMIAQQIRSEIAVAMKARDQVRLDTLRGAVTAFTNELVSKGRKPTEELTDAEAVVVLKRLGKQRKDAMEQFEKGGRHELAEKEALELKIIEAYLPQGASREDIERVARIKKDELGVIDASGIGKLTGAVMKEFAGTADGNDVKEVVAALFA